MRLPPFDLHAPETLEEATALLERYGEDAAVYCGGTELLLLMKLGFAQPAHLVDVKGIAEARVAVGSVGARPVRAREAERLLAGLDAASPDLAAVEAAGEAAAVAARCTEDANGFVEYKENLVRVLCRRTLGRALARSMLTAPR